LPISCTAEYPACVRAGRVGRVFHVFVPFVSFVTS
jgi:hypothetical protein